MSALLGNVHSVESFGTQDGPGVRFVFFMQGCPLQCLYCHNPDTWNIKQTNKLISVEYAFNEIWKVKGFIKSGGITLSGGEPLLQVDFAKELFKLCKEADIHTCIDTSGCIFNKNVKELLEYTDLVLLDLKHINKDVYKHITSGNLYNTLSLLEYLQEIDKDTWLRYVLVPGLTDNEEHLHQWAKYVSAYTNVKRIDLLPFHQMAKEKWQKLGCEYKLIDIAPPSVALIEQVKHIFKSYNLPLFS